MLKIRVKQLCKAKGVSMRKVETDLGFAIGYLSKLDTSTPNGRKIKQIADYFGVTVEYLMTGKEESNEYYLDKETALAAQDMATNKDLRALYDVQRDMTPEQLRAMYSVAMVLKGKEENKGNDPA